MTCELSHLDGSYVLGALAPPERQEFERHLSTCAECAHAVLQLAGLPGLLGRLDPVSLESPPDEVPVPVTLLPGLVHEVRRVGRRRRLVTRGLAAAAAVAVTVGVLAVTGVVGDDGSEGSPSDQVAVAGRTMERVGTASVSGTLGLESVAWGTRLDLTCSYADVVYRDGAPPPPTYALVVRTRDGRTQQVATWRALPGRTMRLSAATWSDDADIASVEVQTSDGVAVLRLVT